MGYLREEAIIENINKYSKLSDNEFFNMARNFIKKLRNNSDRNIVKNNLDTLYTVVTETIRRKTGNTLRAVQLKGALALYEGDIIGMKTGEGKTYTAIPASIAKSLEGKGVHIATTNPYLARRDYEENKDIYESLGISTGLISEEIKNHALKQKAYACDVVYATSSELAFDYLLDTIEVDKTKIRNEKDTRNFLIIDESDNMLIDEATNPYVISSSNLTDDYLYTEKENAALKKAAFDEEFKKSSLANYFVNTLYEYALENEGSIKVIENSMDYSMVTGSGKTADYFNENYVLIKNNELGNYKFTEKGIRVLSYYSLRNRANEILNNNFLGVRLEDDDYRIVKGRAYFTPKGYERILSSEALPELNELYNNEEFANTLNEILPNINNSLTAYFSLEKGKDYITRENEKGEKEVALVIGGRAESGRNFSEGLQMAVELKERSLSGKNVKLNADVHQAASITTASFLSLYDNVAGMSGTPAPEAMNKLYGKNVTEIATNNQYEAARFDKKETARIDRPDAFYFSEEDRLSRLKSEVINAYRNNRPVLISTRDINESEKLYKELKTLGIDINVLNANTKEEAEIIASAGEIGKVTIATEMAGRGTDIKLGGKVEKGVPQKAKQLIEKFIADNNLSFERDKERINLFAREVYKRTKGRSPEKAQYEKAIIKNAGGLLMIGYGHFNLERVDNQVRGRTGRSGDPGETIFLTSVDDFQKMGFELTDKDLSRFRKRAISDADGRIYVEGGVPEEVFKAVQQRIENRQIDHIKTMQDEEYVKDSIRKTHVKGRNEIVRNENINRLLNATIYKASTFLVEEAINSSVKELIDPATKLDKINIDLAALKANILENFELDFNFSGINTLETLKGRLAENLRHKFKTHEITEKDRLKLIEAKDYAFDNFKDRLKVESLNEMFIREEIPKEVKAAKMYRHYDVADKEMALNAVSEIYLKKPAPYLNNTKEEKTYVK